MRIGKKKFWLILICAAVLLAAVSFAVPGIRSRVVYHSKRAYMTVKYWLQPPAEAVFLPSTDQTLTVAPGAGGQADDPTATPGQVTAAAPTATVPPAATPTLEPSPTALPLPPSILLTGVHCERQFMNNCGPATLSMNLSFYKWGKNQLATQAIIRPNTVDVNTMPYELVDFVNQNTELRALWRYGGDLQTVKALLNLGIPVIIEKGYEPYTLKTEGWMGHFNLVMGYDDERQSLTMHDSYLMSYAPWGGQIPEELWDTFIGFDFSYSEVQQVWHAFNDVFVVVYPPEKEKDVLAILGPLATTEGAARVAYERALKETTSLTDPRDLYFAWFNAGTSLVALQDYPAAAAAYDKAFSIYADIPESSRPYRIMWYQSGPYEAYFYTGRYQDVINLANLTLGNMADPVLEESYYWRGRSYWMLGNKTSADNNLRASLKYHPNFAPSVALLKEMGETP